MLKIYHKVMRKNGMTLVEVVVSMVILAIASLAMASTIAMVNGKEMRSAGGGSLDLQALSFARETLESLKNNVSGIAATAGPLRDNTASCAGKAAEALCGAGELHNAEGLPLTGFPPGSDLLTKVSGTSTRTYKVWDIADGNDNIAYKKVTVSVVWADPI